MKQNVLNIAIYQFSMLWEAPEENCRRISGAVESFIGDTGVENRPDILLLPEFFTVGFSMNPSMAEREDGNTLGWMLELSRRWNMAVAGSFPVRVGDALFNRFYFVTPEGNVDFYDKRHLFRMCGENELFSAGQQRKTVAFRGWNIALNVCYDLRFPIWSRNFGNGYDVMLNVASWPSSRAAVADILVRARAIENVAYYVFANRCGAAPDTEYGGGSAVVDYKGRPVSELFPDGVDCNSGFVTAGLDKEALESFRQKFPVWKDADGAAEADRRLS